MRKRVLTVSAMPPEKCAYALARYSRSPDSISESIEWVRTHDSQKFLESFYFQYGHASIADLGHVVMCFEGISELAATEVEDEPLWDGQARSSRYQNFAKGGVVTPPELDGPLAEHYRIAAGKLLDGYARIHQDMTAFLSDRLPRPEAMKPDMYQRNIAARAFDVARYLLPFGVPTGVGQVTSIRTLERQIRRLKASEYGELRELAGEIAEACAAEPACQWGVGGADEPVAPTLARHVDSDEHLRRSRADLRTWAAQNLPTQEPAASQPVDLVRPSSMAADLVATLLYPVTDHPYRELYDLACSWSAALRREVIDVALQSKSGRDELLRNFRGAPYVFDIVMDIGAYRDLHRHRRCHQLRQDYTAALGFETPKSMIEAGLTERYEELVRQSVEAAGAFPPAARDYLLTFGSKSRFLFKMDFAEAEYICRVRSGVKGHFSYREIVWRMKEKLEELEPELSGIIQATEPGIEDPLRR